MVLASVSAVIVFLANLRAALHRAFHVKPPICLFESHFFASFKFDRTYRHHPVFDIARFQHDLASIHWEVIMKKEYVEQHDQGYWVAGTRVSLDSVVIAFQDGLAPEAIQLQFPALTLEKVYGAITYYLANRKAVDEYLAQQAQLWTELRRNIEQTFSPVVARLRAMLRHRASP